MSEPINTKATTLGGTTVVLLANINSADIIKTVILSATGAIVSYIISLVMKKVVSWWKTRKG
jgi:hypothetical protein